MKKIILISFLIAHFSLLTAFSVSAALTPLVPCGGPGQDPCQFCDLATLIGKIVNFAFYIAIPLGVAFIAWGGVMILIAGGSPEKAKQGRAIIQAAVFGIIIVLGAWLFISTLLQIIAKPEFQLENWSPGSTVFCK